MELVSVDHKLQFPLLSFLLFNSNIYLQLWVLIPLLELRQH